MHATRKQGLHIHRIAAQHDDVHIGQSHLVVEFFLFGHDVGEMLDVARPRQGHIDRLVDLRAERRRAESGRQHEGEDIQTLHLEFSRNCQWLTD